MKIVELARFGAGAANLLVLVVLACGLWGQAVMAQETSANIRGQVLSADGNPVAGRRSDASGTCRPEPWQRARPEAPVSFSPAVCALADRTKSGWSPMTTGRWCARTYFLQPGSQNPAGHCHVEGDGEMDRVVTVTAQRSVRAIELNNGVGSAFSAQDIAEQPAIDRDVIKTLLRDPLAQSDGVGLLSVAGVNPRFNTFSIDGATQTDNFGLSDGTYATSRSPINLDAVESATLAVADYSVLASDFVGGRSTS